METAAESPEVPPEVDGEEVMSSAALRSAYAEMGHASPSKPRGVGGALGQRLLSWGELGAAEAKAETETLEPASSLTGAWSVDGSDTTSSVLAQVAELPMETTFAEPEPPAPPLAADNEPARTEPPLDHFTTDSQTPRFVRATEPNEDAKEVDPDARCTPRSSPGSPAAEPRLLSWDAMGDAEDNEGRKDPEAALPLIGSIDGSDATSSVSGQVAELPAEKTLATMDPPAPQCASDAQSAHLQPPTTEPTTDSRSSHFPSTTEDKADATNPQACSVPRSTPGSPAASLCRSDSLEDLEPCAASVVVTDKQDAECALHPCAADPTPARGEGTPQMGQWEAPPPWKPEFNCMELSPPAASTGLVIPKFATNPCWNDHGPNVPVRVCSTKSQAHTSLRPATTESPGVHGRSQHSAATRVAGSGASAVARCGICSENVP